MRNVRIMVVDDHTLFLDAVCDMLRALGYDVVARASSGEQALARATAVRPDLILMDVMMGGMTGVETLRAIKTADLPAKVIMLTMSESDEHVREALRCGADGYVLKTTSSAEFADMLRCVIDGGTALSPAVTRHLLADLRGESDRDVPAFALTEREYDVLPLVAAGLTNREIAGRLCITERTVNYHVGNVLAKLNVRNRVEAATYAVFTGLIEAPELSFAR